MDFNICFFSHFSRRINFKVFDVFFIPISGRIGFKIEKNILVLA